MTTTTHTTTTTTTTTTRKKHRRQSSAADLSSYASAGCERCRPSPTKNSGTKRRAEDLGAPVTDVAAAKMFAQASAATRRKRKKKKKKKRRGAAGTPPPESKAERWSGWGDCGINMGRGDESAFIGHAGDGRKSASTSASAGNSAPESSSAAAGMGIEAEPISSTRGNVGLTSALQFVYPRGVGGVSGKCLVPFTFGRKAVDTAAENGAPVVADVFSSFSRAAKPLAKTVNETIDEILFPEQKKEEEEEEEEKKKKEGIGTGGNAAEGHGTDKNEKKRKRKRSMYFDTSDKGDGQDPTPLTREDRPSIKEDAENSSDDAGAEATKGQGEIDEAKKSVSPPPIDAEKKMSRKKCKEGRNGTPHHKAEKDYVSAPFLSEGKGPPLERKKRKGSFFDNIGMSTLKIIQEDLQTPEISEHRKREKQERELFGSREVQMNGDASHGKTFSERPPTMQRRLSGLSVEEAVRDKFGCRPRSNSTDAELGLPRRGLCDEHAVLESHRWDFGRLYDGRRKGVSPAHPAGVGPVGVPRGFSNLGNTCFLNATLQCLTYLPTFCQCVATLPPSPPAGNLIEGRGGNGDGGGRVAKVSNGQRITMMIRALLRRVHGLDDGPERAKSRGSGAIAPKAIARAVPSLSSSARGYKFRPGRQEDAHEFLVHLLDAMNDGELKAAGIDQRVSGWRDRLPIPRLDETTFVHRIFGGYLRSQVQCTSCGHRSNTYDPFLDLSLEVSKKSASSIASAFLEFTRKETLDADNRWKCSGCKKRVCATKQLTVFRPPLSLCLQLKRFTFGGGGGGFGGLIHYMGKWGYGHYPGKGMGMMGHSGRKITKPIDYSANLRLPLSDGRKCEYLLTGMVVHVGGSATSGHYTAYVRKPGGWGGGQGKWFHMDDSFVEPVSEKAVLRQKDAYVLFYSRKEVKLELPVPPPRASMTAAEAKSLGKARARARADSIASSDGIRKDDVPGCSSPAAPTENGPSSHAQSSICPSSSVVASLGTLDGQKESKAPANESSCLGVISSPLAAALPKEERKGLLMKNTSASPGLSQTKATTSSKEEKAGRTPANDPSSIEHSSSSSAPSSSSSESEDETEGLSDAITSLVKAFSNPGSNGEGMIETSVGTESAQQRDKMKEVVTKRSKYSAIGKSEPEQGVLSSGKKGKSKESAKKQVVVLDRCLKQGNVEVVFGGRSKSSSWCPADALLSTTNKGNELLGNVDVGKWDDDGDHDIGVNPISAKKSSRDVAAQAIESKDRARKRKMYLDRWDSGLDRGKKKKMKTKDAVQFLAFEPKANPFQRIQSSAQKMRKGRAKGQKGTNRGLRKKCLVPKRQKETDNRRW